jgi:hypothetical protein
MKGAPNCRKGYKMDVFADVNAQLISTKFNNSQKKISPQSLYHYTDQGGLLGIIENKELWATKVQYMNDATEFGRAVDLAKVRMGARIQNTTSREAALLNAIIDKLGSIFRKSRIEVGDKHRATAPLMRSQRGPPMTLGSAAAAQVRLVV